MATGGLSPEEQLLEALAGFATRPLDFVYWAFPWGEAGTPLEHRTGPVGWQYQVLKDLQDEYEKGEAEGRAALGCVLKDAYQIAIRSGHDVGKTAMLGWIIWWALSTFVDTRGRATANTEKQLRTILWSELAKWQQLFIAGHLFKWTATSIYSADPAHTATWRMDAVTWSEDNTEGFAGLHNYGKRVIVVTDEASGIVDKVWEIIDGVMHEANTELLWVAPGNPTKNTGRFCDCWGKMASEWHTYKVDSRDVPFANKDKINRMIALYGADSDIVKVRYLGEFPTTAASQLFPRETILAARKCVVQSQQWEPLILAVDISRMGSNETVASFRKGKDARSIPPVRWNGLTTVESGDRIAGLIGLHQPDAVFIDEGGVGGGVLDYVRRLGHSAIGVQFGGKPGQFPDGIRVANKRAEMYVALLQAMRSGLAIPDSDELEDQLLAIEYYHTKNKEEIILVSKDDMDSNQLLDWADSMAMLYAFPVSPNLAKYRTKRAEAEYDPLAWGGGLEQRQGALQ